MNSTNVPSKDNQRNNKVEVTAMELEFNRQNEKYEIVSGQTLDVVLKDHIQEQGEMGIIVEDAKVNKNSEMEMEDGRKIAMKNPKAYQSIINKQNERNKMQGNIKETTRKNTDGNKNVEEEKVR